MTLYQAIINSLIVLAAWASIFVLVAGGGLLLLRHLYNSEKGN